jgi:hypothetical protein
MLQLLTLPAPQFVYYPSAQTHVKVSEVRYNMFDQVRKYKHRDVMVSAGRQPGIECYG